MASMMEGQRYDRIEWHKQEYDLGHMETDFE
jgi:hypothetical protein